MLNSVLCVVIRLHADATLEVKKHEINTTLPLLTAASLATLAQLLRQLSKLAVKSFNFNELQTETTLVSHLSQLRRLLLAAHFSEAIAGVVGEDGLLKP
eukprot:scaffold271587_cov37-Prasinocladus_malaysianus.AAC.1